MSFIIELENPNDASLIKSLLERIKGIKSVVEISSSEIPDASKSNEELGELLLKDLENFDPEKCITHEEFKKNFNEKVCELYIQGEQTNP